MLQEPPLFNPSITNPMSAESSNRYSSEALLINNPVWRQLVVEWCYSIVDSMNADRELVYLTFRIFDRYLATLQENATNRNNEISCLSDKKAYIMLVLSSLLLATRLFSMDPCCLPMEGMLEEEVSSITYEDVRETSKDIYKSLQWEKIRIPTAAQLARALVKLLPSTVRESSKSVLLQNAIHQIELSVQDEVCMSFSPSMVAWMALENALLQQQGNPCFAAEDITCSQAVFHAQCGPFYDTSLRNRLENLQQTSNLTVFPPSQHHTTTVNIPIVAFPIETNATIRLKSLSSARNTSLTSSHSPRTR